MAPLRSIVILSALIIGSLQGEPVKLSRQSAAELYSALSAAESGFSPANTIAAADNLNAVRPQVEALDKGKIAYQKAVRALAKANPPDAEDKAQALLDQLELKSMEVFDFDLTLMKLTDEEIGASRIKPGALAVIRRVLSAHPAPAK